MNNNLNHNRTLRLKPYYIFGTVALATLLALLAVMHPRGNQFIVESLVTVERSRLIDVDDVARDQLVQAKFSSPETVAAALETLPPDTLGHAGLDGLAIESLADLVSHKLQIQVKRVEGSATENVHVRYASKSQAFAIGLVNAIATHVVENYSERESSPQLNHELERADKQIQSLKQKLTDLRNAQRRQLQDGVSAQLPSHQTQDEVTTQPDGATKDVPMDPSSPTDVVSGSDEPSSDKFSSDEGSSDDESIWEGSATEWAESPTPVTADTMTKSVPFAPTLPEVYELNSQWSAISNALAQARLDLEEALDIMTPTHPVVVRLTTEVKELEQLLSRTPQFIRSEKPAPTPSLTPAADLEAPASGDPRLDLGPPLSSGGLLAPGSNLIQTVGFSEGASPAGIAESQEFKARTAKIDGLKDQLAKEINDRNALAASPPTGTASVSSEAELIDSHCPVILPFDLLTLFLPAGVLALVAAIARTPAEPPAVLFSVSDAKKSLRSAVIGTISTKNGPGIPAAEPGGPPTMVRWLVFASEVICVAAAVLVLISIVQIPGYARQFFSNPFSAFVTSFDFVVQFIGQT